MSTYAITGANRGLGLELTKQLAARGEKVYALCRKTTEELSALAGDVIVVPGIDVTKDDVGAALAGSALSGVQIDVLVHNAGSYGSASPDESDPMGVFQTQSFNNITMDIMRETFEINTLGPLRVTQALQSQVTSPGGKIAIVSTLMGSMADNGSSNHYAYRSSKAAVNMVGKSMSIDFKEKSISVALLHPGHVVTGFGPGADAMKKIGGRDIIPAVNGMVQAIDAMTMENTGTFVHCNYGEGLKPCPW